MLWSDDDDPEAWKRNGFSPLEAKDWDGFGFSASLAKDWKKAGFSPSEAGDWKARGFSLSEAKHWKKSGISPAGFMRLKCPKGMANPFALAGNPYQLKGYCMNLKIGLVSIFQTLSRNSALVKVFDPNWIAYLNTGKKKALDGEVWVKKEST